VGERESSRSDDAGAARQRHRDAGTGTRGRCAIDDRGSPTTRRRRRAAPAAALTVAAAVALAGCGGSGDEADATTSDPDEAVTSTAEGNTRLSAASWATYEEAGARARKANRSATAVFRRCADKVPTSPDADAVAACMGGAAGTVVDEGRRLLETLDALEQEVSGACASALANLSGNVKLYVSSVSALESSVENDQTAGMQGQIDDSLDVLAQARTAQGSVTAACKPVAG
jgi:hypothetical protein